jgi:uncharacterized membrane protein YhaH (DUF805 family)
MEFGEAVRTCFGKYATFSGRARRSEYWWFALFCMIVGSILAVLDGFVFGYTVTRPAEGYGISVQSPGVFSSIWSLVTFLPWLGVSVRRLHDTGRSGWWFFILLVPLIGILWFLYLLVLPGDPETNAYGPDSIPDAEGRVTRIPRVPRR